MSGGGAAPKAPDLSGNVKSANDTFNTATTNANQTMTAAKSLNDTANNHLQTVAGAELPMMQNVNRNANTNLDTYQNTFAPLQAQQAQQARDYTSGDNIEMLRGRAVADANASQQAARRNSAAALAAEGVDPASIHGGALDRQAGIAGAAQTAGAANQSYLDTMNTGRQLVAGANQLGLQVGAAGDQGATTGSNIGANTINTETGANTGQINNLQGANSYLNTGISANKSAGDIATQGFQNQMAQYQAEQAAKASQIGQLTSIAGTAAMFMEAGGPVPHKGALPVPPIPGSTDTKPALLTPGEFVIPKDVVDHKGNEFFHKLIDSTRLKMNERRAIPHPVFAHQSNH